MISEHAILSYLAQVQAHGWAINTAGSLAAGWHLVYKGRLQEYHVFLDVDDEWMYLQCPLLQAEADPECQPALYHYLLRANDRMFLAKFTLFQAPVKERANWIALTVECAADRLDAGYFALMTEALAKYAEEYGREIQAIAFDPDVATLVTGASLSGPRPHADWEKREA